MKDLAIAQFEMARRGKIVENFIRSESPNLLNLFYTYQNEAIEARKLLESSLRQLNDGSKILEVGGGILALAVQLASEGYQVTTVEPVGEGFTGISNIMDMFLQIMKNENLQITLLRVPIEECEFEDKFNFIFSINVMEHLRDPLSTLKQLVGKLELKGKYRFFCPNYDFPYEPHFKKWLWRRRNGSFYLETKRAKGLELSEQEQNGLHRSINYITFRKVKKFAEDNEMVLNVNRNAFANLFDRALNDTDLRNRHGNLLIFLKIYKTINLKKYIESWPPSLQPVIDVEVY